MSDDREPIIDALLEELLGEQQPPDLTQRILGAHDAATDSTVDVRRFTQGNSRKSVAANGSSDSNGKHAGEPKPVVTTRAKRQTATRKSSLQTWASVAVVLIGVAGFFAWYQWSASDLNLNANAPDPGGSITPSLPTDPARTAPYVAEDESNSLDSEDHNQEDFFPNAPAIDQEPVNTPDTQIADASPVVDEVPEVEITFDPFESPVFERKLELAEANSAGKLIASINQNLQSKWRAVSIEPLPAVNDRQWFYRAVSFLFDRAPKQTELAWFQRTLDREEAVDRMLASAQFDERWANFFVTVLAGSSSNRKPVADNELQLYLFESLREGKPYDQLAFELITAAGSNRPGQSDFNPATNFLLGHQQIEWPTPSRNEPFHKIGAMEKVSQVFLGTQMQCARCHDHHGLTQQQYYQMVSFFTQMKPIKPADEDSDVWQLSNTDYPGSNPKQESYDDADVFYTKMAIGEDDDQTGASAYPAFLDGQKVPTKSGRVAVLNRRQALANFIVSSDQFPKALVNRIWDEAFGYGFTQPIEDMGEHNPPTHPELLDTLATNFRNSGFDLKPLIKWIVLSQAFDRRSRVESDRLVGRPDAFSSFARLDRDLLYGEVPRALYVTSRALREGGLGTVNAQLGGADKNGKKLSPQKQARLQTRLNVKKQFIKDHYGNILKGLGRSQELTDLQRVIHVFLATVGRLPTQVERNRGIEIIKAKRNAELGMQEICLVILNSEEFVDQH